MKVVIKDASLRGTVRVPCSKSEAHRAIICAAFADKPTLVKFNGASDDILATADCISALGAGVESCDGGLIITPVAVPATEPTLRCRESGSTLRFLLPVAASLGSDAEFILEGRLPERPLAPLDAEMLCHGSEIIKNGNTLKIKGKMTGSSFALAANVSSQFISGILMALPIMGGGSIKLIGRVESARYIDMTLDAMNLFGIGAYREGDTIVVPSRKYISPEIVTIGADWSSAAFWVSAGALSKEGITCEGVDLDSTQGDIGILDVVSAFGADVIRGENSVIVKRSDLKATVVNASDIPDLVPVISSLAAGAVGETHITDAARLRIKESDRLSAMHDVLTALGAEVTELDDGLRIVGRESLSGGVVDSHNDHRIAMSAAIASMLCAGEVTVNGAECVSKSYKTFWEDFAALGGVAEISEDLFRSKYEQ